MCTPSAGAQTTYMQVSLLTNLPIASDSPCDRDLFPAPLLLAVKVPPVIGTRNQSVQHPRHWLKANLARSPALPLCHEPLAYAAELHCSIQWEVLWEPSPDHSFSTHQPIKDLVDDKIASPCGGRIVHQEGSSWSHFHFGWTISDISLLGFARISVDTGAQSVQRLKQCIHMPVLQKSGRWIEPSF